MKNPTKQNSGRRFRRLMSLGSIALMVMALVVLSCNGTEAEDTAHKAYDLRLSGKVDEAKTLLETHLADNPKDAEAYYELARLHCYITTSGHGGLASMKQSAADALTAIDKAREIDPDNLIYCVFKAHVTFLNSYIAMQSDGGDAAELVGKMCTAYEAVLKIDPRNGIAMLHLIEIYGVLPAEMGGDKAKAETYTKQLEKIDAVLGAKAQAIIMPESEDASALWHTVLDNNPGNADVLEALGMTYLRQDKADEGVNYIKQAIAADPTRTTLYLDIDRYHLYKIMADQSVMEAELPPAEAAVNEFLASKTIPPLKAYAIGLLAKINYMKDNKVKGDELKAQAESIDPYFSMASAVPHPDLFIPLGEVSHNHRYLFQPL